MATDNKEAAVHPASSQCFTQLQSTARPRSTHIIMGGLRRRRRQASQPSNLFCSEAVSAAESFIILSVVLIVSPSLSYTTSTTSRINLQTHFSLSFGLQSTSRCFFFFFFFSAQSLSQPPVSREGEYEKSALCINIDRTLFRRRAEGKFSRHLSADRSHKI